MARVVVGIDPGFSGALAVIAYEGGKVVHASVYDAPVTKIKGRRKFDIQAMVALFRKLKQLEEPVFTTVVIELAGSRPGERAQAAFRYGEGFGMWQGIAAARGFDVVLVHPRVWKRRLNLSADKQKSLVLARKLFPSCVGSLKRKKDDGRGEALLIAWYALKYMHKAK